MSNWTYINGIVNVYPMGRTQAEKKYILDTVLDHLPKVYGSEGDMDIYPIQMNGMNCSSNCDEFQIPKKDWRETQSHYILTINGNLRDTDFDMTFKNFQKWICRLAKRIHVGCALVRIQESWSGQDIIITSKNDVYSNMFEPPTWTDANKTGEPNWCEYLMWNATPNYSYPEMLMYKYYRNENNDKEVYRRLKYLYD